MSTWSMAVRVRIRVPGCSAGPVVGAITVTVGWTVRMAVPVSSSIGTSRRAVLMGQPRALSLCLWVRGVCSWRRNRRQGHMGRLMLMSERRGRRGSKAIDVRHPLRRIRLVRRRNGRRVGQLGSGMLVSPTIREAHRVMFVYR
jgi:hypothetical protein